jgi:hypothetical protein
VVRQGDDKWFNIVKWSLNAMIGAERRVFADISIKTLCIITHLRNDIKGPFLTQAQVLV